MQIGRRGLSTRRWYGGRQGYEDTTGTDVDAVRFLCRNLSKITVFTVSLACQAVFLMLPLKLVPNGTHKSDLPNRQSVEIPKSQAAFESYVKPESTDSFGGKPLVASELGPCFAELLVLRLRRNSWY